MTADTRMAFLHRFADVARAARERGEVRDASPNLRVFQFGPVTLDRVQWVSEREDVDAVSRVEREDGEYMTVMVR